MQQCAHVRELARHLQGLYRPEFLEHADARIVHVHGLGGDDMLNVYRNVSTEILKEFVSIMDVKPVLELEHHKRYVNGQKSIVAHRNCGNWYVELRDGERE